MPSQIVRLVNFKLWRKRKHRVEFEASRKLNGSVATHAASVANPLVVARRARRDEIFYRRENLRCDVLIPDIFRGLERHDIEVVAKQELTTKSGPIKRNCTDNAKWRESDRYRLIVPVSPRKEIDCQVVRPENICFSYYTHHIWWDTDWRRPGTRHVCVPARRTPVWPRS